MSEFKVTGGKWRKYQVSNGDMKITCDEWNDFATIGFTHRVNTAQRRQECLYNALLISKAPEMLEMLNECLELLQKVQSPATSAYSLADKIKQLIHDATTL